MADELIGEVFSFYVKPSVAAISITQGNLKVGDTIRIKGHTTDFTLKIDSMQIEREAVTEVTVGQSVGIKVPDRVRPKDTVFKITE